jgi:Tfp pilus assembly protein PilF
VTRSIAIASTVLVTLSRTTAALADPSPADRALAQSLFDEGRSLLQSGQVAEACSKLERSEALDPSGGTMLNLALCHEKQGRTASAWTEYHDAIAMARRDKREEREEFAQKHILALGPMLSRLTVKVATEGLPEGFEILRNGAPLARAGWNAPAPVDPGPQEIVARARGYEAWTATMVVGEKADAKTIEVPALRKAAAEAPPPPPVGPVVPASTEPPPASPPAPTGGVQRPLGFALVGVGAVAAVVGVGFGVHALSRDSTAHDLCKSDTTCSSSAGLQATHDAVTSAKATDGLVIGGLLLAGAGLAVALTAKTGAGDKAAPVAAALTLAPRRTAFALSF